MDVNSQPKYTMLVENYMVFVKGGYEEALSNIIEKTCYSIVEEMAWREREAKSLGERGAGEGRLEIHSAII